MFLKIYDYLLDKEVIKVVIGKLITYYHRWVEKVDRKITSNFKSLSHSFAQKSLLVQVFLASIICLLHFANFFISNKNINYFSFITKFDLSTFAKCFIEEKSY